MTDLALIGAAHIHTPAYIDVVRVREDTSVKLVWDHDHDRAQVAAHQLGARCVEKLGDIWNDPRIAGIIVCTETNRHEDILHQAIEAGKAIFVEKPMSRTSPGAFAIADKAARAGIIFQTGYFLRYHPSIRAMRDAVHAGFFGRANRIHARLAHPGALDGWFDTSWQWMADANEAGPDAFHDLGIHLVDLLAWIGGPIDRVIYDTDAAVGMYPGMDTSGAGMVRFASGALGVLEASWADAATPSSIAIQGTAGYCYLGTDHLAVHGPVKSRMDWSGLPALDLDAGGGLAPFLDVLAGKEADLVNVHDAARTIAVMDAFTRSKLRGAWSNVTGDRA